MADKVIRSVAASAGAGMPVGEASCGSAPVSVAGRACAGACARGVGNTPRSSPLFNALIDYCTIRFDGDFRPDCEVAKKLAAALCLDFGAEVDDECGRYGYTTSRLYDEDTYVRFGGERNESLTAAKTWILEMSGGGCRAFECRFMSRVVGSVGFDASFADLDRMMASRWAFFLETALFLGGVFTHIDVALDDFSGRVPYPGVIRKVESRSYVSSLRARGRDGLLDDWPLVEKKGIGDAVSYYIGSESCLCLNIYNKKREREAHSFVVDIPSWTRWELRYHHEYAVACVPEVIRALRENRFPAFAAGLLGGVVSFRSLPAGADRAHLSRFPVWRPWERFLRGVSSQKIVCQARAESTVSSNAKWLDRDASPALSRCVFASPENALAAFRYLVNSGFARFGSKDLIVINNYRASKGLPAYKSKREALAKVAEWFDLLSDCPDEVAGLFGGESLKLGSARYDPDSLKGKGGKGK